MKHVFRTDWEGGQAFYHPFDGFALEKHPDWPEKYPKKLWSRNNTIGDWLAEFHELLNSEEYEGNLMVDGRRLHIPLLLWWRLRRQLRCRSAGRVRERSFPAWSSRSDGHRQSPAVRLLRRP